MAYYIRLFTTSPLSTLIPLQAQMIQQGYQVAPAGTNKIDVFYATNNAPLAIDLTDSTNQTTRQEIMRFIDVVAALPRQSTQGQVLDVLARALAVVAVGVPDDYDPQSGALDAVIDIMASSGAGLFQVDGEGFYEDGQLILELLT